MSAASDGFEADLLGDVLPRWRGNEQAFVVAGRTVALRPVVDSDLEFLFYLATCGGNLGRWRLSNRTVSPASFSQFVWGAHDAQFIVCRRADGTPVGHVGSYQTDEFNGTTKAAAILHPDVHRQGWPLEGMLLFLKFLFEAYPLRIAYFELPGFNVPSLSSFLRRFVHEEGRLTSHVFAEGKYWDLHMFALPRESWDALRASRVAQRLMRQDASVIANRTAPSERTLR